MHDPCKWPILWRIEKGKESYERDYNKHEKLVFGEAVFPYSEYWPQHYIDQELKSKKEISKNAVTLKEALSIDSFELKYLRSK